MIDLSPSKLFAVIVVYNKSINNSDTINNLLNFSLAELKLLVVDNSIIDYNNKELCKSKNINYISMSGNKGLSKAYNAALDYVQNFSSDNDLIIWLDDDTHITEEYFITLKNYLIQKKNSEVFVPIIYGQNGKIYSPNNAGFLKNKLLKSPDDSLDYKKFNAINSCLAVKLTIYKKYRYSEKLFLDSVDQNFFEDLRQRNTNFTILPTTVSHNFSQREKKINTSQMANRLEIRVKDLMTYSQRCIKYTVLGVVKAFGWGVVFSWKSKSLLLLSICVKYSIKGFFNNIIMFMVKAHKNIIPRQSNL